MEVESHPEPSLQEEGYLRMRRWLRYLLLSSLVLLTLAVWSELPQSLPEVTRGGPKPHVTQGPEDTYIRPGERVGFIQLGLSIQQVEQRLGRGRAKPTQTAVLYRFEEAGLTCAVQKGQVISVLVTQRGFQTVGGVEVGCDADLVVRELGDGYEYELIERSESPDSVAAKTVGYTLHYWREGIHVTLIADRVQSILISASASNT